MTMTKKLLVPREKYLTGGVHIGLAARTSDMKRFIYKIRPNGMAVLNVGLLDKRIGFAVNMLMNAKSPLIVSRKEIGREPAKKLAEAIGTRHVIGRFMPGSLTNPSYKEFFEPDLILATDPLSDRQVIKEAKKMRIPVISLADTYNDTTYIDLVLPCNNKSKKSIGLIYWIIAKTVCEKKQLPFEQTMEDFGFEPQNVEQEEVIEEIEEDVVEE